MQRYFLNENYVENHDIKLVDGDYHHASRVMRMSEGDTCYITFENSITVIAEVTEISNDTIYLSELEKETSLKEMPYQVTIACGYTKSDKLEWVAQKATELGMSQLIGFPSVTSVVKWDDKKRAKKTQRLEKIVKEAAEQSHRQAVPLVNLYGSFKELQASLSKYTHVLIAYEEAAKAGEKRSLVKTLQSMNKGDNLLIIFGPEGGLSLDEVVTLEEHGALRCALGPRILRAETAPLYALSAMSFAWELQE